MGERKRLRDGRGKNRVVRGEGGKDRVGMNKSEGMVELIE